MTHQGDRSPVCPYLPNPSDLIVVLWSDVWKVDPMDRDSSARPHKEPEPKI